LTHERTLPHSYMAVPVPAVVAKVEKIRTELTDPPRAIPVFLRNVITVRTDTSLLEILELVATNDFSQFPVYETNGFRGLLTENGITRWLAHHAKQGAAVVRLDGVVARGVLGDEETTENVVFVNPRTPVADVRSQFSQNELLEAVLISA